MLVSVKDANEGVQESCRTMAAAAGQATPAVIDESSIEENSYPFIQEEEVKPKKTSNSQSGNQLSIRIQCNGVIAEFFGNNYYTSRNFTLFMTKMGGKYVSNR